VQKFETLSRKQLKQKRAGGMGHVVGACLASVRPCVPTPVPKEKDHMAQLPDGLVYTCLSLTIVTG
jgi:hypothetical protein